MPGTVRMDPSPNGDDEADPRRVQRGRQQVDPPLVERRHARGRARCCRCSARGGSRREARRRPLPCRGPDRDRRLRRRLPGRARPDAQARRDQGAPPRHRAACPRWSSASSARPSRARTSRTRTSRRRPTSAQLEDGSYFLVLEYVDGETLSATSSTAARSRPRAPSRIARAASRRARRGARDGHRPPRREAART